MFKKFLDFFHEPKASEPIADEAVVKKTYKHFRWRMFYSCFIAYVVFHMLRKNLVVALPEMAKEFNYSNTELGLLGASLYLTYGVGKFVNGMLADRANVRKFIPTALFCSAIANLCFVVSTLFITPGHVSFFGLPSGTILLWCMAFFWGANGWFQSGGFPPIAKSLSYWFSNSERGTVWSLWSTSHQIGVCAAAFASGYLVQFLGWRAAFYVPAVFCLLISLWLFDRLRDRPSTIGLPDVEVYRGEITQEEAESDTDNRSYFQVLKESILCNKIMWLLAISYVFVYVIRFGTEDWLVKYLVEVNDDMINKIKKETNYSCVNISQHYLLAPQGVERRIRKRERNGSILYYLSDARVISTNERIKQDRIISERQYYEYLQEVNPELQAIEKVRHSFIFNNLFFKLDIFDFDKSRGLLSLELPEDGKVMIPSYVRIIKDVSDNTDYKNYNLAKSRKY